MNIPIFHLYIQSLPVRYFWYLPLCPCVTFRVHSLLLLPSQIPNEFLPYLGGGGTREEREGGGGRETHGLNYRCSQRWHKRPHARPPTLNSPSIVCSWGWNDDNNECLKMPGLKCMPKTSVTLGHYELQALIQNVAMRILAADAQIASLLICPQPHECAHHEKQKKFLHGLIFYFSLPLPHHHHQQHNTVPPPLHGTQGQAQEEGTNKGVAAYTYGVRI